VQKKQLPAELRCEQCLHLSALGSGLAGEPPAPALHALSEALPFAVAQAGFHPATALPFHSRAPPASF
jgi:hypothetical protein